MAHTLNQLQQTLLLAIIQRGPLPRFHTNTFRALVDRGLVTPRRMVTPAGRKYAADLTATRQDSSELSQLIADARASILAGLPPAPPPPPPPTPEEIAELEREVAIWARLESLHSIFWQRENWTNPSLRYGPQYVLDMLLMLLALIDRKLVTVQNKSVPVTTLRQSRWLAQRFRTRHPCWEASEQDKNMFYQSEGRRGGDDLKTMSWSAYRELRRQCPHGPITLLDGIPFAVFAETSRTVIMAGNLDAGRTLSVIAQQGITTFGVMGYRSFETDEEGDVDWPEHEAWQLTQLCFTAEGLAYFKDYLVKNGLIYAD